MLIVLRWLHLSGPDITHLGQLVPSRYISVPGMNQNWDRVRYSLDSSCKVRKFIFDITEDNLLFPMRVRNVPQGYYCDVATQAETRAKFSELFSAMM